MSVLGGSVNYLYWSDRRIKKILDDNGIRLRERSSKFATPTFGGMAPQIEISSAAPPLSIPKMARTLESALGELLVGDLRINQPVLYIKGKGSVVFSEFVEPDGSSQNMAVVYTEAASFNEGMAAICLFGSLSNFADRIRSAEPTSRWGWTCSAAPEVNLFLKSRCAEPEDKTFGPSREELAETAYQIATTQGMKGAEADTFQAWRRAFTYGDVQDSAEWAAEVYYDVDLSNPT
ncbi:hypothetical protein ACWEPL_65035 [Nonomuraea sp. NPDC004186]